MSEELKHPINIKLTDRQFEYFSFICFKQKRKMSEVIREFIDGYIEKNNDIIKHEQTHYDIHVETEDGKRIWVNVTKEEEKRNYTHIKSKNIFKKKSEKT
jgi:hypothetical protein